MTPITPYFAALLGAVSFAVIFRTPRHYFPQTVLVGFFAGAAPRLFPETWSVGFATFIAALGCGAISHVFARTTRAPAQCFLIPSVIFLVPGTTIYRAFSAALSDDSATAVALALNAVMTAFGITFGLLIANWVVPSRKTL
jgi:uncharacterized membrane protein YjjB (DUF3815 family)